MSTLLKGVDGDKVGSNGMSTPANNVSVTIKKSANQFLIGENMFFGFEKMNIFLLDVRPIRMEGHVPHLLKDLQVEKRMSAVIEYQQHQLFRLC